MKLRKFASQNFVNEDLEGIADALMAKARIDFGKLETRQIHGFPFAISRRALMRKRFAAS